MRPIFNQSHPSRDGHASVTQRPSPGVLYGQRRAAYALPRCRTRLDQHQTGSLTDRSAAYSTRIVVRPHISLSLSLSLSAMEIWALEFLFTCPDSFFPLFPFGNFSAKKGGLVCVPTLIKSVALPSCLWILDWLSLNLAVLPIWTKFYFTDLITMCIVSKLDKECGCRRRVNCGEEAAITARPIVIGDRH